MFEVDWSRASGWEKPKILPYHTFQLDPCNLTLHYAIECFQGLKAYHGNDGITRLFRPEMYIKSFRETCVRMSLPEFDENELIQCLAELVNVDKRWVPTPLGFSLYIRPVAIAMSSVLGVRSPDQSKLYAIMSPAGPYFPDSFKPLRIYTEKSHSRAYPGGIGQYKAGANYSPTISILNQAEKKGYHQVLWLTKEKITGVGASNFFFLWKNKSGETELVTAPLDEGLILPGVIRDSVLTLSREKNEIKVSEKFVTIHEFVEAVKEKRVIEAFLTGTTVTVAPIGVIHYNGTDYDIPVNLKYNAGNLTKELYDNLLKIQYGGVQNHPWQYVIAV